VWTHIHCDLKIFSEILFQIQYLYSAKIPFSAFFHLSNLIFDEDNMLNLNKTILTGHVGKDPEIKFTPTGKKVARFNIATGVTYKKPDGTQVTKTSWHIVEAWGKKADIAETYIKKGMHVLIEGTLDYKVYEKNEITIKTAYIHPISIIMLDKKKMEEDPSFIQTDEDQFSPEETAELNEEDYSD